MERHRTLAGIFAALFCLMGGGIGYWLGTGWWPDLPAAVWFLTISLALAVFGFCYSGWRTLRSWGFRIMEGQPPNMPAIDRFEIELEEEIKEELQQQQAEQAENPFEFDLVLRDNWDLRGEEVMLSTGDRDRAERAHRTAQRDLEQLDLMEFYENWIFDKNFDYLVPSAEDRSESRTL